MKIRISFIILNYRGEVNAKWDKFSNFGFVILSKWSRSGIITAEERSSILWHCQRISGIQKRNGGIDVKRKVLYLLLAAMTLALTACGGSGGSMTKEKLLEDAETITIDQLAREYNANSVNAKEEYTGKHGIVPGFIIDIQEDYCDLSLFNGWSSGGYLARAYLGEEDIKQLSNGDIIRVVGVIGELEDVERKSLFGTDTNHMIHLDNAYYVDEISELSGVVQKRSTGSEKIMGMSIPVFETYIEMKVTKSEPQKIVIENIDAKAGDEIKIPITKDLQLRSLNDGFEITLPSSDSFELIKSAG